MPVRTPDFDNDVRDDGTLLVAAPAGELDLATVPTVRDALERCTDGHRAVVLDLRGVTFMDSTGVRLLLEMHHGAFGDRFSLVAPRGEVGEVLDVTGIRPMFRWVDEPADALPG